MNRKLVGILVCMLLIASISNVFGVKNQTQIHDVGIVSINSPVDDGPAQKFPVAVTIKNYGNFEECCFKTRVKIGEIVGTDWIEEYNETVCLPGSIQIGEEVDLTDFPDWEPDFLAEGITCTKEYKVIACTELEDPLDENPDNNCKNVTIRLDYWHDVGVDVINSPDSCISAGAQSIEAIVENLGTFPELALDATAEIKKDVITVWGPVTISNIDLTVPLGGTQLLNFGSYTFIDEGPYELTVCIPLAVDDFPANNCLTKTIIYDITPPEKLFYFCIPLGFGMLCFGIFNIGVVRDVLCGLEKVQWRVNTVPTGTPTALSGGNTWELIHWFRVGGPCSDSISAEVFDTAGNSAIFT